MKIFNIFKANKNKSGRLKVMSAGNIPDLQHNITVLSDEYGEYFKSVSYSLPVYDSSKCALSGIDTSTVTVTATIIFKKNVSPEKVNQILNARIAGHTSWEHLVKK